MLIGVLAPGGSDASIKRISIQQEPTAVKRRVGVVPDRLALSENLTVWEHFDLIRSIYHVSQASCTVRSAELLDVLDLAPYAHTMARDCSYGTRKKLSLAMALLPNPRVLILDEPFEGLDPLLVPLVRKSLRAAAGRGATMFLTIHALDATQDLIQQYAILRSGCLIAEGDTASLTAQGLTLQAAYLQHFAASHEEKLLWLG